MTMLETPKTVLEEIVEIILYIDEKYGNALEDWKIDNGNPSGYIPRGSSVEKYDFVGQYENRGELKQKIDRFVELSKQLSENDFKYIDRTNQEFEGGVRQEFTSQACESCHDSSVDEIFTDDNGHNEHTRNTPARSMKEIEDFILGMYEDGEYHGNDSCGAHLHMSFKSQAIYSTMTNEKFFHAFTNFMFVFGRMYKTTSNAFFTRLVGNGSHNQPSHWSLSQFSEHAISQGLTSSRKYDNDRYRYVNYPYAIHKTIEIRGLPFFKEAKTTIAFDYAIFAFVEAWNEEFFNNEDGLILEKELFSMPKNLKPKSKNYKTSKEQIF